MDPHGARRRIPPRCGSCVVLRVICVVADVNSDVLAFCILKREPGSGGGVCLPGPWQLWKVVCVQSLVGRTQAPWPSIRENSLRLLGWRKVRAGGRFGWAKVRPKCVAEWRSGPLPVRGCNPREAQGRACWTAFLGHSSWYKVHFYYECVAL